MISNIQNGLERRNEEEEVRKSINLVKSLVSSKLEVVRC